MRILLPRRHLLLLVLVVVVAAIVVVVVVVVVKSRLGVVSAGWGPWPGSGLVSAVWGLGPVGAGFLSGSVGAGWGPGLVDADWGRRSVAGWLGLFSFGRVFVLAGGAGCWAIILWSLGTFLIFPNFLSLFFFLVWVVSPPYR